MRSWVIEETKAEVKVGFAVFICAREEGGKAEPQTANKESVCNPSGTNIFSLEYCYPHWLELPLLSQCPGLCLYERLWSSCFTSQLIQ
jgi:hypothetical protein